MRKSGHTCMLATTMIAGALACASAGAQTMYRCGNAYQAFPCETGQGKAIGSVGNEHSAYRPVSDAECAQRGADSLKVVWAREAGLIQEKALAQVDEKPLSSSRKADARQLIADVYNRRGSAPEVRAAIEADCVVEKEKEATAAMYRPAGRTEEKRPAAVNASSERNAGPTNLNRKETLAADNTARKTNCERHSRRLESVHRAQRAGGNMQAMDELNQERRDIQRSQQDAGC